MPYTATRRSHNIFGRKIVKYFAYRRAKRVFSILNRELSLFEDRYARARNHA